MDREIERVGGDAFRIQARARRGGKETMLPHQLNSSVSSHLAESLPRHVHDFLRDILRCSICRPALRNFRRPAYRERFFDANPSTGIVVAANRRCNQVGSKTHLELIQRTDPLRIITSDELHSINRRRTSALVRRGYMPASTKLSNDKWLFTHRSQKNSLSSETKTDCPHELGQ